VSLFYGSPTADIEIGTPNLNPEKPGWAQSKSENPGPAGRMTNRFPGIKGAVWRSLQNAAVKGAMRRMEAAAPKGRLG
jgi:hypothetical protein